MMMRAPGVYPDRTLVKLESIKPRTKVEYEHLTESSFDVWDLKDLLFNGELFSRTSSDNYIPYIGTPSVRMINDFSTFGVYRKVERPVEWWEDAKDYIDDIDGCGASIRKGKLLVEGEFTQDQLCDLARILLEQEGE